jgi:hypothetical protein
MNRPRPTHPLAAVLWANAVLLLAILIVLATHGSGPGTISWAQVQSPAVAGSGSLFAIPAQLSVNTWGCYLVDTDAQTLCAYQYLPGEKQLRLVAARGFKYDRGLTNFNTTPAPLEVRDWLDREAAQKSTPSPTTAPAQ